MSRSTHRMAVVLAGLLAAVAAMLPGTAARAAPATGSELSSECADLIDQVAATRTAGVTAEDTTSCVTADLDPAAAAQSINATACSQGYWTVTRTTACTTRPYVLSVILVQSRQVIGRIYYSVRDEAVTDPKASTWTHTISFTPNRTRSWGVIAGTQITGEASCSGQCSTTSGTIAPRTFMAPGPAITGVGRFQTPATAPGAVGSATTTWRHWFLNVNWLPPASNSVSSRVASQVRCDNKLGGITTAGCVFPDFKPTLIVSQANATYHRHIQLALQYHMRGLLTRMQNESLQTMNRNWACPRDPPRPDNYSCDEYPFASTWEGAYTGNHPFGRTFDGCQLDDWLNVRTYNDGGLGFSSCMIVKLDNSNGGTELGEFYNNQRVIDGDKFWVTAP